MQAEEAGAQLALGGHANPVAVAAKRVGQRVDEADLALAVLEAVRASGRARVARQRFERMDHVDRGADLVAREHEARIPRVVGIQRHELDEAHLVRMLACELCERQHLRLGEVAHPDGVDLDRMRIGELRERLEAAQDAWERVAAGHLEEAVALQRVDGHVEAVDARLDERAGIALEQEAVGRDAEVLDPVDGGQHLRQAGKVAPHQRFAAGQAHVADAHRRQHGHESLDLLEAEHLVALQPGQALRGHAVLAAEVAAIGDRHAHVADVAAVPVAQGLNLRHHASTYPIVRHVSPEARRAPGRLPVPSP